LPYGIIIGPVYFPKNFTNYHINLPDTNYEY
jgi:hypothetical protein